jgi:hypothetical protein
MKRIQHQAEALKILETIKGRGLSPEQCIKINASGLTNIELNRYGNTDLWVSYQWLLPLYNSIFFPLLERGLKRYKRTLQRVARTGDVSRIKWRANAEV